MATEKRLIYADSGQESVEYLKRNLIVGDSDFLRGYLQGVEALSDGLAKLPPVDAVEVVHGRWEWLGPYRYNDEGMIGTCSVCKQRLRLFATNYCPNCGAKMDGDGK